TVDGATHVRVTGRATTIFFPTGDGRYEAASPWQGRGYWHCPAAGDRAIVNRLPAGAEPIGSHTRRAAQRTSESRPRAQPARRRSTARFEMTQEAAMKIADELARETNGSDPRPIPGGFRWSEQNEAAQFTTTSPEYGQKVVIVVSIFADGSAAVDFFGDEVGEELAAKAKDLISFLSGAITFMTDDPV